MPLKRVNELSQLAKSAFTLIELLVVIAIIALLLAILGPSLTKAKQQAETVMCRSNLKQWGIIFKMYANEHNGMFPQKVANPEMIGASAKELYPRYLDDASILKCPIGNTSRQDIKSRNMWSGFWREAANKDFIINKKNENLSIII